MISVARPKNSKPNSPVAPNSSHGATQRGSIINQQSWQGPLPPPASVEHFERIVPGAAARLIAMAEAEQQQRHKLESGTLFTQQEAIRLTARDSLAGMLLGAVVALAGMGASIVSFMMGAAWPLSVAFLSLPIMIVATELVRRKH